MPEPCWPAPVVALESDLVDRCREAATALGAYLMEVGQHNAKRSDTTRGFPDLVLVCAGHVVLIEVKRKGEAVERECAAIERAEKAEAEARRWEWVAKHTYVCPLGEMKPGEPGSYVIEVRPSDAILARYEEEHHD